MASIVPAGMNSKEGLCERPYYVVRPMSALTKLPLAPPRPQSHRCRVGVDTQALPLTRNSGNTPRGVAVSATVPCRHGMTYFPGLEAGVSRKNYDEKITHYPDSVSADQIFCPYRLASMDRRVRLHRRRVDRVWVAVSQGESVDGNDFRNGHPGSP